MPQNQQHNALVELVDGTPRESLTTLAAELAGAQARVFARIATAPEPPKDAGQAEPEDRLLDVKEAAKLLGVPVSWLYRNARQLPFTRKLGSRTLRFDRKGIDRWLRMRQTVA